MGSLRAAQGLPAIGNGQMIVVETKKPLERRTESGDTLGPMLPDIPGLILYKEPSISSDSGIDQMAGTPGNVSQGSTALPPIASDRSGAEQTPDELHISLKAGTLYGSLRGHSGVVTQCHVLPSYIITSSLDSTLRLWSRETLRFVVEFKCDSPVHRFLCLTLDRKFRKLLLLAATEDGKLVSWKVKFGSGLRARCTNHFPLHPPNPVRALAVSPDGRFLASGCCFRMLDILPGCAKRSGVRGTLKTWDLPLVVRCSKHPKSYHQDITHRRMKTMRELVRSTKLAKATPTDSDFGVCALAFSPDGSKLAVGFGSPGDSASPVYDEASKMIAICSAETLATLWIQNTVSYGVQELAFLPAIRNSAELLVSTQRSLEKLLVSVREDEDCYENVHLEVRQIWEEHFQSNHRGITVSPDRTWVASVEGHTATLRATATGRRLETLTSHTPMRAINFSEDGKDLLTTSQENTADLWKSYYTHLDEMS